MTNPISANLFHAYAYPHACIASYVADMIWGFIVKFNNADGDKDVMNMSTLLNKRSLDILYFVFSVSFHRLQSVLIYILRFLGLMVLKF